MRVHPPAYEFVSVDDEWTPEHARRYRERACSGVRVHARLRDLGFLRDLPGLRSVVVDAPVRDDTAVFDCAGVEHLMLLDRCRKNLSAERLPDLRYLDLDDRSGLESAVAARRLERLVVYGWKGDRLDWLTCPSLREVHFVGKKQVVDANGLAQVGTLEAVSFAGVALRDLGFTVSLPKLEELALEARGVSEATPLDLSPLASVPLVELRLSRLRVRSLQPLEGHPTLRHLQVDFDDVLDGDVGLAERLAY